MSDEPAPTDLNMWERRLWYNMQRRLPPPVFAVWARDFLFARGNVRESVCAPDAPQ